VSHILTVNLASVASPPAHQTLRPSSPATTLKNSIAATDKLLQDQRNQLKKNKKDHKATITAIKKEVDTLGSKLGNSGGNDERQRQRVLQFTQNIRQADDAVAELAEQIEALRNVPDDEAKAAVAKKREWQKERTNKEAIATDLDNAKAETDRQARGVESDIATAIQKRERLQQRQARLNEQHERLIIANKEGYTAKQRKEQEHQAMLNERAMMESQYRNQINSYERRANELHMATAQNLQAMQHLDALSQQPQHTSSVPATPDGHLPGSNSNMSPLANPYQSFTFPNYNNTSTPGSLRGGRGRSSSMLSNISGFTDGFSDDFASPNVHLGLGHPFHATNLLNGRKGSHGSGSLSSGTSSQSSSQRDPLSPVPNAKLRVGF
jgi:septal ring factor EnvC (AmiA/AmiB activator)